MILVMVTARGWGSGRRRDVGQPDRLPAPDIAPQLSIGGEVERNRLLVGEGSGRTDFGIDVGDASGRNVGLDQFFGEDVAGGQIVVIRFERIKHFGERALDGDDPLERLALEEIHL